MDLWFGGGGGDDASTSGGAEQIASLDSGASVMSALHQAEHKADDAAHETASVAAGAQNLARQLETANMADMTDFQAMFVEGPLFVAEWLHKMITAGVAELM